MLAVRETIKFAGQFVIENGPLFIEFDTYRYHGHSMSDPGVTYRTKDEISDVRKNRDPLEICRQMVLSQGWAEEKELKDLEKKIRKDQEAEIAQIKNDPFPTKDDLYTHVGSTENHYIRGVEIELSQENKF